MGSGAADKAAIRRVTSRVRRSPALSVVRFGQVAMPEPLTGNGRGGARCIRPSGRRDLGPDGRSSLWAKQAWEPEHKGMVAASKYPPRVKLHCGKVPRADPLDPKGRPMLDGEKRTSTPLSRGGVGTQAPVQGSQR